MKLQEKVAIVTGGSKGIGLGCVRVFAKYGCKVVIAARGQEAGQSVAEELTAAGHIRLVHSNRRDLRGGHAKDD